MADETLDWELKLADLMSGPLAKIEEKFADVEKAMGALKGDGIDKALGRKAKSAEENVVRALDGAKAKLVGARADFAQAWSSLMTLSAPVGARIAGRVLDPMVGALGGAATRVRGALGGAIESVMGSHLRPVFQRVGARWQSTFVPIGKAVGGAFTSVFATHLAPVGQRLSESLGPMVGRASSLFAGMGGGLARFVSASMTVLGPLGAGFNKLFGAAGDLAGVVGGKLGPALSGLGKHAGAGLGALLGIGGALTAAAAAITIAAGKWAIGGLAFKEDTLNAFKTMLGTQDAAQRVFKQATKFAATTPFSSEEVVGGFQKFLVAGFKEDQLDMLMKAVGDVGANMGTEKMNQVITGLSQVKAKGKLQGEEMMQLAEAGVGQSAVFEALSKTLGISTDQAKAQVSGGKVTGEQGIAAILEAIKATQSGGKLGSAMEGKSQTLTGLWSSLLDIPSTLLFASDMDGVTAPIKRAIKGVIDSFNEGAPLFNRATGALGRVGAAWGKAFGAMADTKTDGIFGKLIDGVESFFTSMAPFAEGFFPELVSQMSRLFDLLGGNGSTADMKQAGEKLATTLGIIAGGFIVLGKALGIVFDGIIAFSEWIGEIGAKFFGGTSGSLSDDEETLRKSEAAREQMRLLRSGQGGPGELAATGQPLPPTVTTTVGEVHVHVGPGQENAGISAANAVQGHMPQQLTNFATEMGG